MIRRSFVSAVAIGAWIAATACSSGSATPLPPPAPPPSSGSAASHATHKMIVAPADAGVVVAADEPAAVTFKRLCAPCHGDDAKGYVADHAPSLVTTTFLESADDAFLRSSIELGRPGTSMASYGKSRGGPLDDAALDRVVAYLRANGPAAKPLPPAGVGDATRGAKLYAANCQHCHGDRNTRGDAVHLANARFITAASDAFLRYAIVNGRAGTPMVAWGTALKPQELDDIVAAIRAFATPPSPATDEQLLPAPTGSEPLVLNPKGKAPDFTLTGGDYVPAAQVKAALDAHRKMIIIDARPPSEWRRVHVAGAVSIAYHDLPGLDRIPNDGTWIIPYCACPHHLSGIVMQELRKRGYPHVAVLDEGILDWHRRGFPVVAAPGVKPPPAEAKQP